MDYKIDEISTSDSYKLLASVVVPRPIALVTSRSVSGVVNAAPFSFFNMLGGDPLILGIGMAPRGDGSKKDSLNNIEATGSFVVNLVDEALAQSMNICATDFPAEESELLAAHLSVRDSAVVPSPVIVDAPAHLECRLERVIEIGRNHIVLGLVVAFGLRDSAVDREKMRVDTPGLHMIGRMHGGGWYTRTSDLFNIDRISYANWVKSNE
jgi:flavin reductase (DIM6/NTAB) family NADH-FMN oxidoreductase RutF